MRLSEVVLGSLIAVACAGCPGTIEDLSGFEALAASRNDAGAEPEDAGLDAETPALDAAPEAAVLEDAAEPDAGEQDANMGWDGSLQLDAAEPPDTSEAGADSGLGCDFQ